MVRAQRPDIVLMDIQLPDDSGLDVTRQLKADAELRDTPIIAVTALALGGDEERVLEAGCDAYISKPISIPNFLHTIERLFAERGPNRAECDSETAKSLK